MSISAHEHETGLRRQLWTSRAGGRVMGCLLWPETANGLAELLQLITNRQLLRGGKTIAGDGNRGAVDQLSRTTLEVVFDGGP